MGQSASLHGLVDLGRRFPVHDDAPEQVGAVGPVRLAGGARPVVRGQAVGEGDTSRDAGAGQVE
jgi:hypothetical protein